MKFLYRRFRFANARASGLACRRLALLGLLLGIGATRGSAQSSVSTAEIVGVTNSAISSDIYGLNSNSSSDGSAATAAATQSFTGMDGNGTTQTMTFSGTVTASSTYGQLHCDASGTVTNTYYNSSNPIYYNSTTGAVNPQGSPDGFASLGFSDFSDTLQYGGALQAGYQARYIFHVDGTNSGYGSAADLSVSIAGNSAESFFDFDPGAYTADWATMDYAINGTTPQSINVQFSDQFTLGTQDVADGSTLSGESNFSDTATLAAIEIVDANGNLVSGVTVISSSGMNYMVVPEPGTWALVLLAALWLLQRQKIGRKRGGPSFV